MENQVELGFILMRHNEGEVKEFLKMAERMGVDRKNIISPCVRTPEQGLDFLPNSDTYWIYEREKLEEEGCLIPKRVYPQNSCPWLYYSITIQVDGNVVPCCRDPHGRHIVGNLLEDSLDKIWNGPKIREFRRAVHNNQEAVDICRLCPGEGFAPLF
jgi:radical SAM protein with 4Fe4S-binding SPASM domain